MTTELSTTKQDDKKTQMKYQGGSPDSVYGLGLIGGVGVLHRPGEILPGRRSGIL